jgi:predicted short-subunit dehydrogenase-like oxidoreductase (DUF2520 family)
MRRITKTAPGRSRDDNARLRTRSTRDLTVAIVGAGRLGTALGLALKSIGCQIEVVAAQRASSARRAAKMFGAETLALSAHQLSRPAPGQLERLESCSLVLIATPDDTIATVAKRLSETLESKRTSGSNKRASEVRRVVLHTSGALASDVLKPMRRSGFAIGSLHPLVSISESRSGAELLRHGFFSVEGDAAAVRIGRSIVSDLGGESFRIDSRRKALYHAAAVTASPHITALFDIALEMLIVCGLTPRQAQRVLLPLVRSTVSNLATQEPARALTGTFKRGDVSTVQMHLAALKAARLPQALSAYVLLGQRSIAMMKKHQEGAVGLDEIARILARVAKNVRLR